jgi:hypothetical protein
VQPQKRSLTVAGQWRIFTALPEHPTSELLYVSSTVEKHLPRLLTWSCIENSRRIETLQDLESQCVSAKRKHRSDRDEQKSLIYRKNRHRHSLRGSIRIDVNLVGLLAHASLNRSNLPSALLHQWHARLDPPRLQWLGRSGIKLDSHTTPSHKFYTWIETCSQIALIESHAIRFACFTVNVAGSFGIPMTCPFLVGDQRMAENAPPDPSDVSLAFAAIR